MSSQSTTEPNKRRAPRSPLSLLVQYKLHALDELMAEYSADISLGGMFIRTDEPREKGSTIYFQFALQGGLKIIEGLGRVVHVNPPGHEDPGMGVEFVNLDAESMALVENVVRGHLADADAH